MSRRLRLVVLLAITAALLALPGHHAAGRSRARASAAGAFAPIGSAGVIVQSDSFTRPADAAPYLAGDRVSATVSNSATTPLRAITAAGRYTGMGGYITAIRLFTDQKTNTAKFRLHFYNVAAPPTAVPGDNVPMILAYANFGSRMGTADLAAMTTETDTTNSTAAHSADFTLRIPYQCATADTSIYYALETLDAFTPATSQGFSLALGMDRD